MKKILKSSLLFLSLISIHLLLMPTAYGQSSDKIDYYLDVGIGIPAAPPSFTQSWKTGYGIGAGASYEIQPSVKLQLYGQYYRFGFDKKGAGNNFNTAQSTTDVEGSSAEIFNIMLNIIYEFDMPGIPTSTYFSVGSGYFRAAGSDFTISTSDGNYEIDRNSGSSLGVNGAVGLKHALNKSLSLYLEAKFVTGLFENRRPKYVPISLGISF